MYTHIPKVLFVLFRKSTMKVFLEKGMRINMFQESSPCFWYRKATQTFGGKGCPFWNFALKTWEKDTFFQKTKKIRLVRIARKRIYEKIIKKCLFFSLPKAGTFPNNFFWDKMSSF